MLIAFSIAAGASAMRGGGLPWRGSRVRLFATKPPSSRQVEEGGELGAVAEGAGGGEDGVAQGDARERRPARRRRLRLRSCLRRRSRLRLRSRQARPIDLLRASKTGPARQTNAKPARASAAPHSRGRRRSRRPSDSRARPDRRAPHGARPARRRHASSASGRRRRPWHRARFTEPIASRATVTSPRSHRRSRPRWWRGARRRAPRSPSQPRRSGRAARARAGP